MKILKICELLQELLNESRETNRRLGHIERELLATTPRHLSKIKIYFTLSDNVSITSDLKGDTKMPGPITMLVGQSTIASVVGFDQFGNPMPADFVMPAITFTISDTSLATEAANTDGTATVTAIAPGDASLKADVTSAEGLALTDVGSITISPVTPPKPVLSSIKVLFTTPV